MKYSVGMYDYMSLHDCNGKFGVGMGLDGKPYLFDSEEEYGDWYVKRLQQLLVDAGFIEPWEVEDPPHEEEPTIQYGLVKDGVLLDFVETKNVCNASDYFDNVLGRQEDAIIINLTELLRGI